MPPDLRAASKRRSRDFLSTAIRVITVAVVFCSAASTVDAEIVRVVGAARVHATPDLASDVLVVYQPGTTLDVGPRQGDWYPVLLPADERGVRPYGYISAAVVEAVERPTPRRSRLTSDPRGAHIGLVLADTMIAEHVSERVSRIDIGRNRAIGEEAARRAARRLLARRYRLSDAVLTSSGLYADGSAVLRLSRSAEPGVVGSRSTFEDSHWDLGPGHAYVVRTAGGSASDQSGAAPFWISPWLDRHREWVDGLRIGYRTLERATRLAPRHGGRSEPGLTIPQLIPVATATSADFVTVLLIRGRQRPNPPALKTFFLDAFVDRRYEISGAVLSGFLVDGVDGDVLFIESRIENTMTESTLAGAADRIVDRLLARLRAAR
jgi:hypothetical protein